MDVTAAEQCCSQQELFLLAGVATFRRPVTVNSYARFDPGPRAPKIHDASRSYTYDTRLRYESIVHSVLLSALAAGSKGHATCANACICCTLMIDHAAQSPTTQSMIVPDIRSGSHQVQQRKGVKKCRLKIRVCDPAVLEKFA